jgi:hypothetical protein
MDIKYDKKMKNTIIIEWNNYDIEYYNYESNNIDKSFFSLFLDFIILSYSLSLSFKANRKLKLSIIDLLINIRTNNK